MSKHYLNVSDELVTLLCRKWGFAQQDQTLVKQCCTLISALIDNSRHQEDGCRYDKKTIASEITDTLILMRTVMHAHGITPEDIDSLLIERQRDGDSLDALYY